MRDLITWKQARYVLWCSFSQATMTALMAPLFGNSPVLEFGYGFGVGAVLSSTVLMLTGWLR